nr:LacI family DNA-binding transcriptional regulator [Motilibacter deserti]
MREVAAAAGVSTATASNVFNGTGRVSDAVRARVVETAAALGYAGPNPAAASLRRGRVGIIGVVLAEGLGYALGDPAAGAFLAGVAEVGDAADVGLTLLPVPPGRPDRTGPTARGLPTLERAIVDGAIVYSIEEDSPALPTLVARRLPLVAVDSPRDATEAPWVARVLVRDRDAAADAATHLAALGHRRVAVVVDRLTSAARTGRAPWSQARQATSSVIRERLAGYADAWRRAGLPLSALEVHEAGANSVEAGQQLARDLVTARAPVTAVACVSDVLALGMTQGARELGLGVPRDLSVVGFDDSPLAAQVGLTSVAQPLREKGETAARALLAALAGQPVEARTELPATLVVRGSTGPPAQGEAARPR